MPWLTTPMAPADRQRLCDRLLANPVIERAAFSLDALGAADTGAGDDGAGAQA